MKLKVKWRLNGPRKYDGRSEQDLALAHDRKGRRKKKSRLKTAKASKRRNRNNNK